MTNSNELFLVLGMHRGGTSLLTRSLGVLGIALGDNLLPAVPGINDKGFFEDRIFHSLNLKIFELLDRSALELFDIDFEELKIHATKSIRSEVEAALAKWQSAGGLYALKDPRAARLMPFWSSLFDDLGISYRCVVSYRNPASVVCSMMKIYDLPEVNIFNLWLTHMLESFIAAGIGGLVVSYENMVHQPAITMKGIQENLGILGNPTEIESFCETFIDDSLQRNKNNKLSTHSPSLVTELENLVHQKFINGIFAIDQNFLISIKNIKTKFQSDIIPIYNSNKIKDSNYSAELDYKALALKIERLNLVVVERDETIQAQSKLIDEHLSAMAAMEQMIHDRDKAIQAQTKLINERISAMAVMEQMIRERDETIQSQSKLIDENVSAMATMEQMIHDRDKAIQAQTKLINERISAMAVMEQMIRERDETIQSQSKLIDENVSAMATMEQMIHDRDKAIQAQTGLIDERVSAMAVMEQMIRERDETIQGQSKLIDEHVSTIAAIEEMIHERDKVIQEKSV